jgi:hypothetical protein
MSPAGAALALIDRASFRESGNVRFLRSIFIASLFCQVSSDGMISSPDRSARRIDGILRRVHFQLLIRSVQQIDSRDVRESQDTEEHVDQFLLYAIRRITNGVLVPTKECEKLACLRRNQCGEISGRVIPFPVSVFREPGQRRL